MWTSVRVVPILAVLGAAVPPVRPTPPPQQVPRFEESVQVDRVLMAVRVMTGQGSPILGLGPDDFRVRVDGHDASLESVEWIAEGGRPLASPSGSAAEEGAEPGRLIVFFFQKSLEPSRVMGLLQMLRDAHALVDGLAPGDRVAILSFDSHLKLWCDFTDDAQVLGRILDHSILFEDEPGPPVLGPYPSLAAHFDAAAARRAAVPETAFLRIAEALMPLPGAKSLVFFGGFMGRLGPTGVWLDADYGAARQALLKARVTVFSLDLTNADYHSLEVGLQQVSADTGGFYARTHLFPKQAMERLEGALAGYYLLAIVKPDLPEGPHRVRIDLVGRKGTVLAKSGYVG